MIICKYSFVAFVDNYQVFLYVIALFIIKTFVNVSIIIKLLINNYTQQLISIYLHKLTIKSFNN